MRFPLKRASLLVDWSVVVARRSALPLRTYLPELYCAALLITERLPLSTWSGGDKNHVNALLIPSIVDIVVGINFNLLCRSQCPYTGQIAYLQQGRTGRGQPIWREKSVRDFHCCFLLQLARKGGVSFWAQAEAQSHNNHSGLILDLRWLRYD